MASLGSQLLCCVSESSQLRVLPEDLCSPSEFLCSRVTLSDSHSVQVSSAGASELTPFLPLLNPSEEPEVKRGQCAPLLISHSYDQQSPLTLFYYYNL